MKIPYVNLAHQNKKFKKNLLSIFENVINRGEFVGGKEIQKFEKNLAELCRTKYSVALNSGTDALTIALFVCGVKRGDEIITPPNSFIASTSVIAHLGAKPVFVDVLPDQNIDPDKIIKAITKKTKVIMPVHLTGRMCNMIEIKKISKKYNLKIIEDSAQSIGSRYASKMSGSFSDIGCFSAHPLKNLNALGDAGYLVTNNFKHYKKIKDLCNLGMTNRNKIKNFGHVSRMDNLQAAILNFRLKKLKEIIKKRRFNYNIYKNNLPKNVFFPIEKRDEFNTYHTFVVQINKRNKLKKYLEKKGIGTSIHYPVPIHLQPASKIFNYKRGDFPIAEKQSGRILSLPIHQDLKKTEILHICSEINNFYKNL